MIEHIIGIVIGSIIIVGSLGIFAFFYFKQQKYRASIRRIGQRAETQINEDLKVWAKHTRNYFIPASLYKYKQKKYFEVDGILVTDRALIVIEIKSIKGGINGNCESLYWTKNLESKQFRILNPVVQNERHIDHIVNMTDMKIPTISLIVFSNRAHYLNIQNVPSHVLVAKHADMFETLDEIMKSLPICFSDYEMKNVLLNLKTFRTTKKSDYSFYRKLVYGGKR